MGRCPIAPPKGFPFSIVCFCHWQQQPKTSLETFERKCFVLHLKYSVKLDSSFALCLMFLFHRVHQLNHRAMGRRGHAVSLAGADDAAADGIYLGAAAQSRRSA